jgi:hypothetical protein
MGKQKPRTNISSAYVGARTEIERLAISARLRAANEQASEPLVTPEAQAHGDYTPVAQTGEQRKAMINRGGTPVARWIKARLLSDSQQAAILHCLTLWRLAGHHQRTTANLDRTVYGTPGDGNPREVEARIDLHRIRDYFHPTHWGIFENVVRFDEPAGIAGSKLGRASGRAEQAALNCVCMVADVISWKERLSY